MANVIDIPHKRGVVHMEVHRIIREYINIHFAENLRYLNLRNNMPEPRTTPIYLVMMIAMFGSILSALYINPILTILLTAILSAWMAICAIWEV
jgi:hypothetical protein